MKNSKTVISLPEFDYRVIKLDIEGTSPIIMHKFGEKAKKQLRDKHQKKASKGREIRKPEEEYLGALHLCTNGKPGFPASGLKKAMVRAAKSLNIVMKDAMCSFYVFADDKENDYFQINGKHEMREDYVKLNGSTADLRYRPIFKEWSATIQIEHNNSVISAEQLTAMLEVAGRSIGLGEMRPEKGGGYGRFKVL